MCLALFRHAPGEDWPFLLVSIRDEDLARPAESAGEWWPQTHPGVVGGRDSRAGGTWLALDVRSRAVAAVFTPGTPSAPGRRTRGELPLAALRTNSIASLDVAAFAPFALLRAQASGATWWDWNGVELRETPVRPGLHVANNDGLDALDRSSRQARWLPRFADTVPVPFDASADIAQRWGRWLDLVNQGLEPERRDALLVRHTAPGGTYGTRSVALLAIGTHDLRYDANDRPDDPAGWTAVALPAPSSPPSSDAETG